jgi:hypothetical protein
MTANEAFAAAVGTAITLLTEASEFERLLVAAASFEAENRPSNMDQAAASVVTR